MKSRDAQLTEAYELILEECQLDAYLRLHPCIEQRELLGDIDEDVEQSPVGERQEELSRTSENHDKGESTPQSSSVSTIGVKSTLRDSSGDEGSTSEGWTEEELSLFFISLSRRSRFFPDLISRDLDNVKSTSQVAHLLSLLRRESSKVESQRKDEETQAKSNSGSARKIRKTKGAHEVSDDWIAFEERMAARLREYQSSEDAEELYDGSSPVPSREDTSEPSTKLNEEDGDVEDSNVISWDTQVLNILLYMRHHQETSPDCNLPNCYLKSRLQTIPDEAELPIKLFHFDASIMSSLLDDEDKNSSYRLFAKYHPVPLCSRTGAAKTRTKKYKEALISKILFRGVELGLLSRISLEIVKGQELSLATLSDRGSVGGNLIWLDTLPSIEVSSRAKQTLQKSRNAAARRLMNTLRWKEIEIINVLLRRSKDGSSLSAQGQFVPLSRNEKERIQDIMSQNGYSELPYSERNRLMSRLKGRVKRFGLEAAMEMPIEAQPVGRKRKDANDDETFLRGKRVRVDIQFTHQRDAMRNDKDEESSQDEEQIIEMKDALVRFKQIGANFQMIKELLPQSARDALNLFNISVLKFLTQSQALQADSIDQYLPANGVSKEILSRLTELLRNYITIIISSSIEFASLGQTDEKSEVTTDHIYLAIQYNSAVVASTPHHQPLESKLGSALDSFRSDPPRLYEIQSIQAHNDLILNLQGLKNISSNRNLFDSYNSTSKDEVVTISDGFILPISSQFGLQMKGIFNLVGEDNQIESDSDESSIYDDSDQEAEIQMRRDERKGIDRELKIDGRVWELNEKRAENELKRWTKFEEYDAIRAKKHERRLWASVGIVKRGEVGPELIADDPVAQENNRYTSLSSDESEMGLIGDTSDDENNGDADDDDNTKMGL